jgi:hypothetical protein
MRTQHSIAAEVTAMSQLIPPQELLSLLLCFAPCFTQPSFRYCVSFIVAMIGGTERLTTTTV